MNRNFTLFLMLCLCFQIGNAQTLIWGDVEGQGDFSGGLNGWTPEAVTPGSDSLWYWSASGDVGTGITTAPGTLIGSPTRANGSVIFNYDEFSSEGGSIPGPAFPYPSMSGNLISPEIDLSASPSEYLFVRFYELYRALNAVQGGPQTGLSFSQDGGVTWFPDTPIDCNPTIAPNAGNEGFIDINIPSENLDITQPLQMRFSFAGDYYFWAIDDVQIYVRAPYETSANPFFSIAPNAQTPVGQMPDAGFLIDVENLGSAVAPNVVASVVLNDASGAEIFSSQLEYGDLDQDSLAENESFAEFFPKDLPAGNYTGTYTVSTDSVENDPTNNTQNFAFTMTDTVFAKETAGATRSASLNRALFDGGPWTYAVGAHYYIPNGDGLFARTISFSIDNNNANQPQSNITGETILIRLYKWVEDGPADGIATPDERTEIGSSFHIVQAGDNLNTVITKVLTDPQENIVPIPLEDDTHYMVMLEYFSNNDETTLYIGTSEAMDYGARVFQDFLLDSTRINFTQMLGFNEDLSMADYDGNLTFGNDNAPVVRLSVGPAPIDVATNDLPQLDDSEMTLSPVPAKDRLTIDLNLNNIVTNAVVEIYSTEGKMMEVIELGKVQRDNRILNLEQFNAGIYFARFISEEGVLTKSFQVIK